MLVTATPTTRPLFVARARCAVWHCTTRQEGLASAQAASLAQLTAAKILRALRRWTCAQRSWHADACGEMLPTRDAERDVKGCASDFFHLLLMSRTETLGLSG